MSAHRRRTRSGPSSRGSRSSNRTSRARKKSYRIANGDSTGSLGPTRDARRTLVSSREILLAGTNRHRKPVLPRREWAHVVVAVRAVWVVRQVEVDHVLIRRLFFDVEVSTRPVRLLAGRRVTERDEEALVRVVMAWLRDRLERGESLLCAVDLELEDAIPSHLPRNSLGSGEDDPLGIRVFDHLGGDPVFRIRRKISEPLKLVAELVGNRGLGVLPEEEIFLSTHRLDFLHIVLGGTFGRHGGFQPHPPPLICGDHIRDKGSFAFPRS